MRFRLMQATSLVIYFLYAVTAAHGDAAQDDPRWAAASTLRTNGNYTAAAMLYRGLFQDYPTSQAVGARLAGALFDAGYYDQSHDIADQTVALNPYADGWAALGYFYKARACRELGCLPEARTAIAILKQRFPEAIATARAEGLGISGSDGAANGNRPADLEEEYVADGLINEAVRAARSKNYNQALALLDDVTTYYGHTRSSLNAMERKAYILSSQKQWTTQAQDSFLDIIAAVAQTAPHSRIRYDAEFRLAALYQRQDKPFEAMVTYLNLAALSQDPRMAQEAAFQAMGARNEMLQRRQILGETVGDSEWDLLRTECAEIKQAPGATALHVSRADLIIAESHHWQHHTEDALAAANYHLTTHQGSKDLAGLATAHLIAGECLQKQELHQDALTHYRWIIDTFGAREPWGYIHGNLGRPRFPTSLARVHYRICDALMRDGTAPEEAAAACQYVVDTFPDTRYADLVRQASQPQGQ